MYHFRKTRKLYTSFPKDAVETCHFCNPHENSERIIRETNNAYVIPNRTFYDQWELRKVIDHAMIIPKRHIASLNELNSDERLDIMNIIAEYEGNGYEIYARSPGSKSRSVLHQHTHLIKTETKVARGIFMLRRPYVLWLIK
jgi:diadenosine tetraphosphate (Ap4A) HIT family hydrolase